MHRPTVGIIALVLLLLAVFSLVLGEDDTTVAWRTGCQRVGLLMGAFWLAMPHLKGVRPFWVVLGLLASIVVLVLALKHPLSLALLAVIALGLGYLSIASRPRRSR
jgi:hypothetical protein